MSEPVDLTNCDREPIHIPGSIQPHGVLLALDNAFRIVHLSSNADPFFGAPAETLIGKTLADAIDPVDADAVEAQLRTGTVHGQPVYLQPVRARGATFDAIIHRSGELFVLELEPADPAQKDLYGLVQSAIADFRGAPDLKQLADLIAQHVRTITGFDRVMVYRFDRDWNGQIIAEQKRSDLEPFLGLNYPASDIPKQARELYRKNWLRFIADRDYVPAPLIPQLNPKTHQPLDMSFCVLRSVSPIHLQYLRNMGVGASMSISLICNGELWGLVACHHYSPRRVPYMVRTASELMGQIMSLQVAAAESGELARQMAQKHAQIDRILSRFDPASGLVSLADGESGVELCSLLGVNGVALIKADRVVRYGQTPSQNDILEIASHIRELAPTDVYQTESLRTLIGRATLDPVAAGVIALPLAPDASRLIVGFRPERIRTVDWAGDPAKTVTKGEGEARLSPRGSFALWQQTVEGTSTAWTRAEFAAAHELRQRCVERLAGNVEEVERHNQVLRQHGQEKEQLFESERAARIEVERLSRLKDDFVATLSHELRTPLNAIQGWTQLLRAQPNLATDVEEALEVIERNTRAQAQMVEDLLDMSRITSGKLRLDVQVVNLPAVIDAAIDTVQMAADAKETRIVKFIDPLHGIAVTGDPHRLQQVFWNLLSNAVKFSPKGSRIRVELKRVNSHVEASVRDNGAGIAPDFLPHVFDRFRQGDPTITRSQRGLGLGLAIARNLIELHGGTISAQSPGENQGSVFTVTLPIRSLAAGDEINGEPARPAEPLVSIKGLHLLVVEDEADSRDLMRRLFEGAGARVTTAGTAAEALKFLFDQSFDAMISDIGLPSQDGYYLVDQLRQLETRTSRSKMPAVAVTAYARAEDRRRILLSGFQMHVAKPTEPAELFAVVAAVTGRV